MSTPRAERATGGPILGSPVLLSHHALLAALALVLLLLAAASLHWPFSWDHGIFAWIGSAILHGGLPYRDAWDVKGPLTFYPFALTEWLAGPVMWGIRALDLLALAAAATAAGVVVRRLAGPGAGIYTALALALQYTGTGYFETAQPDGWAGFLLILGVAPLVRREDRTSVSAAALSAALAGTAVLLKPTYAVFFVAPAAYLYLARDRAPAERVRALVVAGAAFALPMLACALWFAAHGAWESLYDTYVRFNLQQAGAPMPGLDTSLAGALARFLGRVSRTPEVLVPAVPALVALAALRRARPRGIAVLALAALAAFFAVYIQQRYWNRYQWHPAYMSLLMLAGCGLGALWHGTAGRPPHPVARPLAVLLGAAVLAAVLPNPVREVRRWASLELGRTTRAEYEAAFRHPTVSWTFGDSRALADYLRAHTGPGEPVLIWSDPLVNWLSGRASIGRFSFHVALSALPLTEHHRRFQQEFLRDLERTTPRYVAVGRRHLDPADSLNEANIARRFPELLARLEAAYTETARFGDMVLYTRRVVP